MVCERCIVIVENIFSKLRIPFDKVSLGEVELEKKLTETDLKNIERALPEVGFELIDSMVNNHQTSLLFNIHAIFILPFGLRLYVSFQALYARVSAFSSIIPDNRPEDGCIIVTFLNTIRLV
jgi:hypothetical protein